MSDYLSRDRELSNTGSYYQFKERLNLIDNSPCEKCSLNSKSLVTYSCSHKLCFNCIFKYFLSSSFKGLTTYSISSVCPKCQKGNLEINLDDYIQLLNLLLVQKNPNFGQEDNNNENIEEMTENKFCKIHKDKKVIKYCNQCSIALCEKCLMEIHNRKFPNHIVSDIKEFGSERNNSYKSFSTFDKAINNKQINDLQDKETTFMQKLESDSIKIQTKVDQIIKDLNFFLDNYINKLNLFQNNMKKIFQIINLTYYNYYTSNPTDKSEITISKELNDFNIISKKIELNDINFPVQKLIKDFNVEESIFDFELQYIGTNYRKKFELKPKKGDEIQPDCVTKIVEIKQINKIVSSLINGQIFVWDIYSKKIEYTIDAHKSAIWSMIKLSDDMVATGSSDKWIKIWNIVNSSSYPDIKLKGHRGTIFCLGEIEKNKLLSGSDDRTIKLWDLVEKKCIMSLEDPNGSKINCLLILQDPGFIVTGGDDNLLKIWNIYSDYVPNTLSGHECTVWSLTSIIKDDTIIASGSSDNTIKIWDLISLKCLFTLDGHENSISSLKLLNNDLLISASWDQLIKIWNLKTKSCLITLEGHTDIIWDVIQLDNGDLASCSSDKKIIVWTKE